MDLRKCARNNSQKVSNATGIICLLRSSLTFQLSLPTQNLLKAQFFRKINVLSTIWSCFKRLKYWISITYLGSTRIRSGDPNPLRRPESAHFSIVVAHPNLLKAQFFRKINVLSTIWSCFKRLKYWISITYLGSTRIRRIRRLIISKL